MIYIIVKTSFLQQFISFLKTFGIIAIALALIIGNASTTLVTSLTTDIISPFIGLFLPGTLESLDFKVIGISGQVSDFRYGDLISGSISFLIVVMIIFITYKSLSRFKIVDDKTIIKQ